MPLSVSPLEMSIRLSLAVIAGLLLGFDRDERERPAGMRTIMLVTVAATLAMLMAETMVPLREETGARLISLDPLRLPLGILSGIGFIGAGAIVKRGPDVIGVTTAATIWYATVLGLLFGGGHELLGISGTALALVILQLIKKLQHHLPQQHHARLTAHFAEEGAPTEKDWRRTLNDAGLKVDSWTVAYEPPHRLRSATCSVQWTVYQNRQNALLPEHFGKIQSTFGIASLEWEK